MAIDPELAARFSAHVRKKKAHWGFDGLEDLISSPDGFGITTITPLQRAICRVLDGQPLAELAEHEHVKQAFGDVGAIQWRPNALLLLAGIRTFKSMLAAALAIVVSQTADLSRIGFGEIPRYSIVSLKLDLAQVIYRHLVGHLGVKPKLRDLVIDPPTADSVMLRHPSGKPVEVKIVAGSRAGASLVARWSIGAVFDEAPRMVGKAEGVVNIDDMLAAVEGRMLPGAQRVIIGSPWAAWGPVYDRVTAHEGKPTRDLVVCRARADWLNPVWWTPERAADLKRVNPDAYRTDFLAHFADTDESMIPGQSVEACVRDAPLEIPYERGHDYSARIDPATRGNAWTLTIGDRIGRVKRIVLAREWQGTSTDPLKPRQVLAEIAGLLGQYHLDWCYSDQWSADSLIDLAAEFGLSLLIDDWTTAQRWQIYANLREAFLSGTIEIPLVPALIKDLRMIKKRPLPSGGMNVILPVTPDGRHCDYAPAVAGCLAKWLDEDAEPPPVEGTAERLNWEARERQRKAAAAVDAATGAQWWESSPWDGRGVKTDPFA